jgi:hypothetical protein
VAEARRAAGQQRALAMKKLLVVTALLEASLALR